MSRLPNEDLFEGSKMSFGEHLEELRVALFRSVLGLAVGIVIGFACSRQVIQVVVRPLEEAVENFYLERMSEQVKADFGDQLDETEQAQLVKVLRERRLVFDDVYVERSALQQWTNPQLIASLEDSDNPAAANDSATKPVSGDKSTTEKNSGASSSNKSDKQSIEPGETKAGDTKTGKVGSSEPQPDESDSGAEDGQLSGSVPGAVSGLFDLVPLRIWRPANARMIATGSTEGFLAWMKVGIITGLTVAAPWIFWQLWIFVAEGLYPSEKNYVYIYMPFSLGLFVAGASLAYFWVFEPVLGFLLSFNDVMNADPSLRVSEWLSFFLLLPLGFGVGFQLPLVMLFLNRIGILSVQVYLSQWRIAILIIFVAAMLLTPADPQSMLLLALPLTALYFLGILLCQFLPRRQSPLGEGTDPA